MINKSAIYRRISLKQNSVGRSDGDLWKVFWSQLDLPTTVAFNVIDSVRLISWTLFQFRWFSVECESLVGDVERGLSRTHMTQFRLNAAVSHVGSGCQVSGNFRLMFYDGHLLRLRLQTTTLSRWWRESFSADFNSSNLADGRYHKKPFSSMNGCTMSVRDFAESRCSNSVGHVFSAVACSVVKVHGNRSRKESQTFVDLPRYRMTRWPLVSVNRTIQPKVKLLKRICIFTNNFIDLIF